MKKFKSQGLGVNTLYAPLSDSMVIENISGVAERQWYYATGTSWAPDYSRTPLILRPVVTAVNPETGDTFSPQLVSVVWIETAENGTKTEFTSASGVSGYSVAADGTLTMTKNVPAGSTGLMLTCIATYTDPRRNVNYQKEETFTIGCSQAAEEQYKIQLTPARQYYNPLAGDNPVKTIAAKALRGETDVTASVKFFWYYIHNGTEVLIEDNPTLAAAVDPCLAYVSGQGTALLTVNADYENEDLTFVCRIADSLTATAPNIEHVSDRATVRWRIPAVRGIVTSPNGDTARESMTEHEFDVVYRQGGRDVDDAIAKARIIRHWTRKRTDQSVTVDLGCSPTVKVKETDLLNNAGAQVHVSADGYLLGPQKAVVQDGNVVTQVVGGTTYVVIGREVEDSE